MRMQRRRKKGQTEAASAPPLQAQFQSRPFQDANTLTNKQAAPPEMQLQPEQQGFDFASIPLFASSATSSQPLQRQEEDNDLQMKLEPDAIQRMGKDDDEMQMKPEPDAIQRMGKDDDEMQMKPESNGSINPLLKNLVQRDDLDTGVPRIPIQAQLSIGAPGDKYEQEADQVAHNVVEQINAPAPNATQSDTSVQREMVEEDDQMQMKPIVQRQLDGGVEAPTEVESSINQAKGGGQSLDTGLQDSMGKAMGADFSGVKVHTDSQADTLNQSLQAKAFTTGQHVFFKKGEYQPSNKGGQELIAHELTHVVQQNGNAVQRQEQIKPSNVPTSMIQKTPDEAIQVANECQNSVVYESWEEVQGDQEKFSESNWEAIQQAYSRSPNPDAKFNKTALGQTPKAVQANVNWIRETKIGKVVAIPEALVAIAVGVPTAIVGGAGYLVYKLGYKIVDKGSDQWNKAKNRHNSLYDAIRNTPRDEVVAAIIESSQDNANIGAVREAVSKLSAHDESIVTDLAASENGKAALRAMVTTMPPGGKPKQRNFGKLAIEKTFGIANVAGFEGGGLARLWPILEQLPPKHINSLDNTALQTLERYDKGSLPHGQYSKKTASVAYNRALIDMKHGGVAHGTQQMMGTPFMESQEAPLGQAKIFDQVVLHEIGHAIDAGLNIMSRFGKEPIFGGWTSNSGSIPIADMLKAYNADPRKRSWEQNYQPQTERDINLLSVMNAGQYLSLSDCMRAIANGTSVKGYAKQEVARLNHEITSHNLDKNQVSENMVIEMLRSCPMVKAAKLGARKFALGGSEGAWQVPDDVLANYHLNGRIFHKAYAGTGDGPAQGNWVSYELAQRKHKVSYYQWRAPGEWFAEIYAHYFLGVLPENHPAYDWMETFINNHDEFTPQAIKNPTEWKKEKALQEELEQARQQEMEFEQQAQQDYEQAYLDHYQ